MTMKLYRSRLSIYWTYGGSQALILEYGLIRATILPDLARVQEFIYKPYDYD